METCVLIPKELSLVLRVKPPGSPPQLGSRVPPIVEQASRSLFPEMEAALWANRTLAPGFTFKPEQGEMRLDKLEIYTLLESKDVRKEFGCHDTIIDVDGCDVRHCNWVRFVTSSNDRDSVNAVASMVDGEPVYEIIKEIRPNDELIVYFDIDDVEEEEDIDVVAEDEPLRAMPEDFLEVTPPRGEGNSSEMETTSPSDISSLSAETSPILPPILHAKETGTPDSRSSSSDQQTTPSCERYNTVWTGFSPQTGTPAPCTPHKFTKEMELKMMQGPLRRKEKTWLPCDVCGKKFDRPSLLKRHMRTHTGEKPHACDVCGKAFSTSSSLNTHRRIHSGEKPHQCQICGKRFTASSNLYYHRMTHKKEKPHKCSLCAKSFPTPGDLKSHMYVHNGSWPFKCEVCSRGFSKQTNLKNHMLLHSGDKPHECPLCHKKFALQCNLRTHLKTHEGESREDRCISCSQPLGVASLDDSKLCANCVNKQPKHRFSIDALVSPDHPAKPSLLPVAPYPYSMTSSPSELPKPPFYARAMMSAVALGHPRYNNLPLNWPERPIPHRYGM